MQAEISDSDAKELWRYWFYEWAEYGYPGLYEDRVWFKGSLQLVPPSTRGTTRCGRRIHHHDTFRPREICWI